MTSSEEKPPSDPAAISRRRQQLRRSEAGDAASAEHLHEAEHGGSGPAEAVEQEASDGPEGRGLTR
jgi:hypothetical protein